MSWNHDRMFAILIARGASPGKDVKYGRGFTIGARKIFIAKNPGGKAVAYINEKSAGQANASSMKLPQEYGSLQDYYPKGGENQPRGSALRALRSDQDIYCFRFDREEQFSTLLDWYTAESTVASQGDLHPLENDASAKRSFSTPEFETPSSSEGEGSTESLDGEFREPPNDDLAQLNLFARRVRRGQVAFRTILLELYGCKCAVCGQGPAVVLDAAHIWEHALSGINNSSNGLLLRADVHILFDDGLIKINPESLLIEVSPQLKGTQYYAFNGKPLLPRKDGSKPNSEYLAKRYP